MKNQVSKGDNNKKSNVATAEKEQVTNLQIVGKTDEKAAEQESPKEVKPAEESKKDAVSAMIEKFKPEPFKTPEERIEAAKQFEALSKRYKILKDKANDLKTFKAGNDKMNARIIFENAQGFKLEVQNSSVIEKLMQATEAELNILTEEAKNEVLTFEI